MANWNIQFGRTAQIVVSITLLATAGSLFYIYRFDDGTAHPPTLVDPFDRPELSRDQQDFFRAVDKGDVREVRRLLAQDKTLAKITVDPVGTALHIAATRDMVDVARALLDAGADIDAPGQWGGTPLHWAAWLGRVDTLRLLVERGADIERRCTSFDGTPLLWAANGSVSAQRWQYSRFRPGQFRNGAGPTGSPDRWEAERARRRAQREIDYADCVTSLIDAGAVVNTRNREGVPAVAMASPSIQSILVAHGAINDYVPPASTTEPDLDEAGPTLEAPAGEKPLHI